jgi:hypothetical protein
LSLGVEMRNIGRNDPCPCGSGKKFKKCHQGREDELYLDGLGNISVEEMGARIASLPNVRHGRIAEIMGSLDMEKVTGRKIGIRFVDLEDYAQLHLFGSGPGEGSEGRKGGLMINPYKTLAADPKNIYVAISRDVDDGILIHEIAHVLDYLAGSQSVPGTLDALGMELGIPVEHLEHPEEYGYWLDYLQKKFEVKLDADDSLILYLYENQLLIKGREIQSRNGLILRAKSDRILRFLSEHSEEIDRRIRNLPGYVGKRKAEN